MTDEESRWEGNVVDVQVTENVVDVEVTEVVVEIELLENVVEVAAVGMQGRPGPAGAPGVSEDDVVYDVEVDESTPGTTYIGQAEPGTSAATSAWRIKKVIESVGGTSIDWADGDALFDKVWDDRLTYTYGP